MIRATTPLSDQMEIPPSDRRTSVKDAEGQALAAMVTKNRYQRTLEVGFAYGLSAAYLLSAHEGSHAAIDPFQKDQFDDLGVRNLERLGLSERFSLHRDFSHAALPKLLADDQTFDFIFIDGGHLYDQIFVDFYFADLLLSRGGMLAFHDTWMRSTQMTLAFIKKNRRDYQAEKSPLGNLAFVRKIGTDTRAWHHFKEFYNGRSLLKHKMISLLLKTGSVKTIRAADDTKPASKA
jgi:predicted O-methyltransferase YrrM